MGMIFGVKKHGDFIGVNYDVSAKCDCCGATTIRGEFRTEAEANLFLAALKAQEEANRFADSLGSIVPSHE